MKVLLVFFMLFSFVGCGKVLDDVFYRDDTPKKKVSHPDFEPYIKTFEQYYGKVSTPILYGKAEEDENWVGVCTKWLRSNYREIKVDKFYWENANELEREQLIMHELGHCELDRGHRDETLDNECPASIMRSYVFYRRELENCYDVDFDYYMEELGIK